MAVLCILKLHKYGCVASMSDLVFLLEEVLKFEVHA
jgi:hypothetical protein